MENIFKELICTTKEANAAQRKKNEAQIKKNADSLNSFIKRFDKTFCRKARKAAKKGQDSVTIYVPCLTFAQLQTISQFYKLQGYVVDSHDSPFNEAGAKRVCNKLCYPITLIWREKEI